MVRAAGIGWQLARLWPGGRARERQIKRQGGHARKCPLCGVKPRRLPRNADGSLSRSRTTDAQKPAAGVMTAAQLAEHTALRRGAVTGKLPGGLASAARWPRTRGRPACRAACQCPGCAGQQPSPARGRGSDRQAKRRARPSHGGTPIMTGSFDPPADHRARPLTEQEQAGVQVVGTAVGVLGLVGFANSFAAVQRAAWPAFGPLAPTVPLGIDLGIAIFAALDIVLARLDMRPRWVRFIPWSLTAATVYLNVAGQATWFGRVAHAVLPALWVAAVEAATHVARVRAGLAAGTRMDRIRPARWLLAPVRTVLLWRRMVLWEIRSCPEALRRERHRLLTLTSLQEAHGVLAWRWRAPRRTRALYKLGELAPAGQLPAPSAMGTCLDTTPGTVADTPAASRQARRTQRPDTATKVAGLRDRYPDMSAADIAKRLGVSHRTVRRHLARAETAPESTIAA